MVDVEVTTTVDLVSDLRRRLTDTERKVFTRHRATIERFVLDEWVGWRYEGRPPEAPRNVSQSAWRTRVETTEAQNVSLVLWNRARSWASGRPYVAYVHRSGTDVREWTRVLEAILTGYWPKVIADLTAEIAKNVFAPGKPKKLRGKRVAIAQTRTLE